MTDRYAPLFQNFADILERNVQLKTLSRWQIGGSADIVATPQSTHQLAELCAAIQSFKLPSLVIGDGSNLLFDDAGYRGIIIHIGEAFNRFSVSDSGIVTAGAGLWVPHFVQRVARAGLEGCVHAIGIPGRLGGLIVMNGGSQRQGIGDKLISVTVVDQDGSIATLTREECGYAYRTSSLQKRNAIVVEAQFQYTPADPAELRREMLGILVERQRKFPRKLPNCGSVFLSNPAMYEVIGPPGKAIEECGFKGKRFGGAQVSPLHANFIVNTGNAKASDVLRLIHEIRHTVYDRTSYWMDCEVRHLSPTGGLRMAHLAADERWGND